MSIFILLLVIVVGGLSVWIKRLKKDNTTLGENYDKLGKLYDQIRMENTAMKIQSESESKKQAPKEQIKPKEQTKQAPKEQIKHEQPKSDPSARRFVLFDLESSQVAPQFPREESEVIEIAAFMYENGNPTEGVRTKIASFHTYIKPVKHPKITPYCTNLTKITQDMVDNAPLFADAITQFKQWIRDNDNVSQSFWLVSWGHYDRQQLAAQCEECGQSIEWLARHTSLKHEHSRINRTRMGIGMGQALRKEGFTFEGTQHMADAENMFKVFNKYFDRLVFVSPKFIKRK